MEDTILAYPGKKIQSEEGDGHQNGATCLVIAESVKSHIGFIYLVIFEDYLFPIAVANTRIKLLTKEKRVRVELSASQKEYLEPFSKNLFQFYTDEECAEKPNKN